jgi:hypothetical protein
MSIRYLVFNFLTYLKISNLEITYYSAFLFEYLKRKT